MVWVRSPVYFYNRNGTYCFSRAVLSPKHLACEHVALTEVRLRDTQESSLSAFNEAVRKIPEVEECQMIAGSFDYLLKVRTTDIAA